VLLALTWTAPALAQDIEFTMEADHTEVGTEDVFTVTVTVSGAPDSAQLQLPSGDGLETLSSSQAYSRSISLGGGAGPTIRSVRTVTLRMRAMRPGVFRLPPATLETGDRTLRTESLRIVAKSGRLLPDARPQRRRPDPFAGFPFPPGFPDPFDDQDPRRREPERAPDFPGVRIPRGDSDVFLRTIVDKTRVTVGEQVTMSVWVFSRVDLSSVDNVTMPKIEGFWSEDVDSPTQLSAEPRTIDGIPYRAYLLRRRAVFPVQPGTLTIGEAAADITTGYLFAGERRHRSTRPITITVDPLPPGAPSGMTAAQVGQWKLSVAATRSIVELNQPFEVKVVLEGRGNLRNQTVPRLQAPGDAFKIYDPSLDDRLETPRGRVGGRRVANYLVMPKRTGTFTLPALRHPYFDPESGRYEVATSEPLTVTVLPGGASTQPADGGTPVAALQPDDGARNVLERGGLHPIRVSAAFRSPSPPVYTQAWFWPLVAGTPATLGLLAAFGALGGRLRRETEDGTRRRQAKAAHKRLGGAEQLKQGGSAQAFYAEVEKALLAFLEAKLGKPVQGLTGEGLEASLAASQVPEAQRAQVRSILDACAVGRYAPGGADGERDRVLHEASRLMDSWSDA
jgi:hypothetical protein